MMFILYKISHADLTSTDSKASGDQIDRTMFKVVTAAMSCLISSIIKEIFL